LRNAAVSTTLGHRGEGDHLGSTSAEIEPPGWNRAPVELAGGRSAEAFLGDPALRARGHDVPLTGRLRR
jgi:hypothetical protein